MKIAYIMNVDWNWIKQRPHFIAEGLAINNDVTVFFQHRYYRRGYQKRNADQVKVVPMYVIPRGDRYKFLSEINKLIRRKILAQHINRTSTDYVYTTSPDQIDFIEGYNGKVIYDCMDNNPAFVKDAVKRKQVIERERRLVNKSRYIFCSSEKLKSVILDRYGNDIQGKIHIVRNGYDGRLEDISNTSVCKTKNKYVVAYFGTISSWFNFDFIIQSLNDFANLEYRLIGPIEGITIPESSRIIHIGTVEHDKLYDSICDVQCLVMPFVVNELIESVDPVKLYEYINFYKNILCVQYKEVDRFKKFVYFYDDYESFKKQLEILMQHKEIKYSNEERIDFLDENDWKSRVSKIEELLK